MGDEETEVIEPPTQEEIYGPPSPETAPLPEEEEDAEEDPFPNPNDTK